jgi:8-oxo-dGTP pyrophosphatase MutT (NUDIX family)
MLLIAHEKEGEIYWLLPGGGVDFGESLEDALKREFMEELNISINVDEISLLSDSISPHGERHIVNICFRCSYLSGKYALGNDKRLHGFDFFSADEIASLKIYPPINSELISIIKEGPRKIYLGKLWTNE